jgi:hypothetical protein
MTSRTAHHVRRPIWSGSLVAIPIQPIKAARALAALAAAICRESMRALHRNEAQTIAARTTVADEQRE